MEAFLHLIEHPYAKTLFEKNDVNLLSFSFYFLSPIVRLLESRTILWNSGKRERLQSGV